MIEKFLTYEMDHELFKLTIKGCNFWHLCRYSIYNEIIKLNYDIGQAHNSVYKLNFISRQLIRIKQLANAFFHNPLIGLKHKDILIFNHERRVKVGQTYDCIYTDELASNMTFSNYVFEDSFVGIHEKPTATKNLKYTDYLDLMVSMRKRLKITPKIDLEEQNIIIKAIEGVNTISEHKVDVQLWTRTVVSMIEDYLIRYKYYRKIIEKVEPNAIIEVVSYGYKRLVINCIAKEIGIPTIELQHGTMGKTHIAYNFMEKMTLAAFPDYVFLYGTYWKDETRFPIEESHVKVTGWPYYEKNLKSSRIKNRDESTKERSLIEASKKMTILFVSQGTTGKHLSKIAVELSNLIDLNVYQIIYKLHPGEYGRWKKAYPWLIGSDINVIGESSENIYNYFAVANIQVGVSSTALYEGLGYGLKTYIYKSYGYKATENLYENKIATCFETALELKKNIELDNDKELSVNSNYFWEKNSMENMLSELDKIVIDSSNK